MITTKTRLWMRSVLALALAVASASLVACTEVEDINDDSQNGEGDFSGTAFVHLFEWSWNDIADECEQFLGPKGFEAVQVSPPNEHIDHPTWWARYQPVSYKLESRSGTRAEFIDMVRRCGDAGVAVYADVVINHTAIFGDGGVGTGGTQWSPRNHPGFPKYTPENYHFPCDVTNYQDAGNVQNCGLSGLPDLDTSQDYVRGQIAGYLQDLRDIGVAQFRVDAVKHIAPQDLEGILAKAGRPLAFFEVIGSQGEAVQPSQYTHLGAVTEFGFGSHVSHRFKYGQISNLGNVADGKLPSDRAIVYIDNHDNQRGHGGGGEVLTYKDGSLYNIAAAFMLAWPYGYPGIMSSYDFTDTDIGPPGRGGCSNPGFVCEHRWTTIANMVGFRNVTNGQGVANFWSNGDNRLAFGRGDRGFIAINNQGDTMNETLQTGMPAGTYCNIAGGDLSNGNCTGATVTVDQNGMATLQVNPFEAVAFHVKSRL